MTCLNIPINNIHSKTHSPRLTVIIYAVLIFLLTASSVRAQGTFTCFQGESATGASAWLVSTDNCDASGVPDASLCPAACEADLDCRLASTPPREVGGVRCKSSASVTLVPWGGACNPADATRVCDPASSYVLSCQNNLCLISPAASRLPLGAECKATLECAGGLSGTQCLSTGAGGKTVCTETGSLEAETIPEGGACSEDWQCDGSLDCIDGICGVKPEEDSGPKLGAFDYCKQVPDGDQRQACEDCLSQGGTSADGTQKTVYTAVGCIHTGENLLVADLITLFLGVSGGIALLSILAASFLFSTSRGDTNKVKQAKDLMTAAVSGLFFIIFSVIILNFIGVQILRIPGLS